MWRLLDREVEREKLLQRAQSIVNLGQAEKQGLTNWINAVANIAQHFGPTPPPALLTLLPNGWRSRNASWSAFKTLLVAFYERGFRDGLPYRANGTPTDEAAERVTYDQFVTEFRAAHKLDPHPDAREICVLCGGELGKTEVDHWVSKAGFPLFSVCADNLLPICGECNSGDNKGQQPVHNTGSFDDWFHPYLRPGSGALQLDYVLPELAVRCNAIQPIDQPKADNLNRLLNLANRWTLEFKAEYRKKQKELADRRHHGRGPNDLAALQAWLTDYRDSLVDSEPHFEVHQVLCAAMLEPARLAAWHSELGLVS